MKKKQSAESSVVKIIFRRKESIQRQINVLLHMYLAQMKHPVRMTPTRNTFGQREAAEERGGWRRQRARLKGEFNSNGVQCKNYL